MAKDLRRTKNSIVLQGIVGDLTSNDKGNGFSSGVGTNGKKFKKVKMSLRTSKGNIVYAELKGYVNDKVTFYNQSTKESIKVPWADRYTFFKEGFALMKPDYDLIEEMERTLVKGMSVKMKFAMAGDNYVTKDGVPVKRTYLKITSCEPIDNLNMDDANFEELNYVNMDVILKKVSDGPTGEMIVDGFFVDNFGKPHEIQLIATKEDAENLYGMRGLRYGTLFTVVNGKYKNSISQGVEEVQNKAGFGKATVAKQVDNRSRGIYFDTVDGANIIDGAYSPEDIAAAMEGVIAKPETPVSATATVTNDDLDLDLL